MNLGNCFSIKIRGGVFCIVIKIHALGQVKDLTTGGTHWWKGASPIFIAILTKKINEEYCLGCVIKDSINMTEALDWTRKYFTIPSLEIVVPVIKGKKPRSESSKPIQTISQLFALITRKVPMINVEKNSSS